MRLSSIRHIASAVLALTAAACDGATAPSTPSDAAGLYVLESVSGRGPASGNMTLTAAGRAERRVRYTSTPGELSSAGTFEIAPPGILFVLIEQSSPSSYAWRVRGEWTGRRFTIRYPDPADGPDIVETFRRL